MLARLHENPEVLSLVPAASSSFCENQAFLTKMYKAFAENETLKLKKIRLRLLELTIDQGDRGGVGNLRSRSLFMLLAQSACFFLRTCGLPLTPTDGVARIFSLTPCCYRGIGLTLAPLHRSLEGHLTDYASPAEAELLKRGQK